MLRNKPRLKYCGLTVILSNPSRFDTASLLSSTGGHLFTNFCLRPEFNSMMCDVRIAQDHSDLLPGTKCIMTLGEEAMHEWLPTSRNNSLNEARGSVFYHNNIPAIPSYFPQDAADIRNLEKLAKDSSDEETDDSEEGSEDYDSVKRLGRTKRSNYAFWLRADTRKAKTIITTGLPRNEVQLTYHIYPDSDLIINVLRTNKNKYFYLDLETDREEQNLQCLAFSFNLTDVYCVPILDYTYRPAYTSLIYIMQALAIAARDNITVSHNGAAFDFFVLAYKYRVAIRKVYDTMVAMHRCFPDIEKSLGHCVSYWTWEKFHKDEDSQGYCTKQQMMDRLQYCGKDVYTMGLVHKAIEKYALTIPGLQHSIDTAMASIRPYLITSLQGISYSTEEVDKIVKENDRLMMQYLRFIDILIGADGMREVRAAIKGKAKALPNSNSQCVEYFHNILGYPVVARSKQTQKPSLGKKAIFKLALKHDNPVISFIMAYRSVAKETSKLKFLPWKDDEGKVVDWRKYEESRNLGTH